MPKVPSYDNFQTQVAGQPFNPSQPLIGSAPYATAPGGPTPGGIAAEQAGQFGQAATRAGSEFGKIALDMADQSNQVRNNDANNKANQAVLDLTYGPTTGFKNLKGDDALTRPDGKSLNEEYGDKLRERLDSIAATLSNPWWLWATRPPPTPTFSICTGSCMPQNDIDQWSVAATQSLHDWWQGVTSGRITH